MATESNYIRINKTATIYALVDPRDNNIFYVGRTTLSLRNRLTCHMAPKTSLNPAYREYRDELIKAGMMPRIIQLDTASYDKRKDVEEYWIQQIKAWGFRITNVRHYKGEWKEREEKHKVDSSESKLIKALYRHGDCSEIAREIGVSHEAIRLSINRSQHSKRIRDGVISFYQRRAKEIVELYRQIQIA